VKLKKGLLLVLCLSLAILAGVEYFAWFQYQKSLFFPKQEAFSPSKLMIGDKVLKIEIAKTVQQQEKGLSDRESLCSDCGLLFVFDRPGIYPFWMRRMHFDIDILWIAGDQVADITYGAKKPANEDFERPKEIYQSMVPVDKVLEVNAGWVEKNGIKVGNVVKY